jgi:hypothetical protein
MRRRWRLSLGPFIEKDALADRAAHNVVERLPPVIELVRAIKQEVLGTGELAQSTANPLQLAPA